MPPPSADEKAAVARVKAAYGQHDVVAITTELTGHLTSAHVVSNCFAALFQLAHAAASVDVLLLVLDATQRHADCVEVATVSWPLATKV